MNNITAQYSLRDRIFMEQMAREAAARHRTPEPIGDPHPKGVIVQGDEFMTEKISDPDYVPYCGPCVPMQRVRRVSDGFECPTCCNKSNWDLTKFNHNVDVQFTPEHAEAGEKAKAELQQNGPATSIIERPRDLESEHLGDNLIENAKAHAAEAAVDELIRISDRHDWKEDRGKKGTTLHPCGKCMQPFFGKRSRKYCVLCQEKITRHVNQVTREQHNKPFYEANRRDRRHG
jgi:hypothetical protein